MSEYRAYFIDAENRVKKRIEIEAVDDAAAMKAAGKQVDRCDIVVWQGQRVVGKLQPQSEKTWSARFTAATLGLARRRWSKRRVDPAVAPPAADPLEEAGRRSSRPDPL